MNYREKTKAISQIVILNISIGIGPEFFSRLMRCFSLEQKWSTDQIVALLGLSHYHNHNDHCDLKSNHFLLRSRIIGYQPSFRFLLIHTLMTSTSLLKHNSRAFGFFVHEPQLMLNIHVKTRTEWSMWLPALKGAKRQPPSSCLFSTLSVRSFTLPPPLNQRAAFVTPL